MVCLNHCFHLKYKSIIHNNISSSEKIVWSESGEKSAQINIRLQIITVQNISKQICGWVLMWEDKEIDFFFTGGSVIMDYGVSYKHAAFGC